MCHPEEYNAASPGCLAFLPPLITAHIDIETVLWLTSMLLAVPDMPADLSLHSDRASLEESSRFKASQKHVRHVLPRQANILTLLASNSRKPVKRHAARHSAEHAICSSRVHAFILILIPVSPILKHVELPTELVAVI